MQILKKLKKISRKYWGNFYKISICPKENKSLAFRNSPNEFYCKGVGCELLSFLTRGPLFYRFESNKLYYYMAVKTTYF